MLAVYGVAGKARSAPHLPTRRINTRGGLLRVLGHRERRVIADISLWGSATVGHLLENHSLYTWVLGNASYRESRGTGATPPRKARRRSVEVGDLRGADRAADSAGSTSPRLRPKGFRGGGWVSHLRSCVKAPVSSIFPDPSRNRAPASACLSPPVRPRT